jgi:hypothetical protein
MKTKQAAAPAPTSSANNADIAQQLGAIEKSVAPIVSLTTKTRKQLEARSANVPDELIEQMIQVAMKNGGKVGNTSLDVDATNATLTDVKAALAAAASSRLIAQQMEDDATSKRATVSDEVFSIYTALERLVHTPAGNSLLRTYATMKATVKNRPRKPRKKKTAGTSASGKAQASSEQTSTPAPAESPAEAPVPTPAPAAPVAAAAVGASHP